MNIVARLLPLSTQRHRAFAFRYVFALGTILGIAVIRVLLDGILQGRSPYTLFLFALPITAWVVGMRPSLAALLLGALIGSYFFIGDDPFDFSDVGDLLALDVYLVAGLGAIFLTNALAKLYQGLMERQAQLEAEISQRLEIDAALRESERRFRVALQNSPISVAHSGRDLRYTWLFNLPGGLNTDELVGKLDDEFSAPDVAAMVLALKQEVLNTGRLIRRELETEAGGPYQAYLISGEPAHDENGVITGVYTTALDISAVKLAERRNALLYQLASALSSVVTLSEIAEVIFSYAFKLLGNSDTGSIRLLNEAGTALDLLYHQGLDPKYVKQIGSVPLTARTPISDTVRNSQPLWIETEIAFEAAYPEYFAQLSQTKIAKAVFCVPMIVNGRVIGGMGVSFVEERQFSLAERDFYLAVGQVCAQAIERARLTEKAQAVAAAEATNEERQRLARDLHDSVSQTLYAATNIAEAVPRIWSNDLTKAVGHLSQVVTLNRAAMAEMRTLLLELRPEAIVRTEMQDLLRYLVDAAKGRKHIEGELLVTGADEAASLPEAVHVAYYRIAQESINNILKHTQSKHFTVTFEQSDEVVRLAVADEGQGINQRQSGKGIGLSSMRERAASIGATLEIQSVAEQGTTVEVRWVPPAE